MKKCSNYGGNHTANYSGCPVYKNLTTQSLGIQTSRNQMMNIPAQLDIIRFVIEKTIDVMLLSETSNKYEQFSYT